MDKTLVEIHDKAREEHVPIMKDDGMDFLLDLIQKNENVRDILEVGTAVGYSSIQMAKIRWDNEIDTLEINPKMYTQALKNIEIENLQDRIHVHFIDGAEFETKKVYDLIFIDAAKSQYRRYLEHFMKNSRIGTIFVFDNLNFHGIVDDENLSHNRSTIQMVHKIKKFREHIMTDSRFDTTFYNIGDGIAISIRKE